MVRARTLSCLTILSAAFTLLSLPAFATAQCGSHTTSGGQMQQQQLMQMQLHQMMMQMQMQQQLMLVKTQQLQMQKQVQSKLIDLMQEMSKKDSSELVIALEDSQAETRWAAARTIGQKGLPLQDSLIEHLTDPSGEVRQAARTALIQLSATQMSATGKSKSRVDFGPSPSASRTAQATAARKWSDWWAKQSPSSDSKLSAR